MSKHIFEELPSRPSIKSGDGDAPLGATQAAGIEKKARQLVYDARYQVNKALGPEKKSKINPTQFERLVSAQIDKSAKAERALPIVIARARKMISKKAAVAEDFIPMIEDAAANTVASALYKVFVKNVEIDEEIELSYIKELAENPDKKYKIRVTDKKTGNSYVRYATREKISELRANPNIQSVEMTEYGEPREGERKRGEETARATGGGKKAKKDYDGDGKIESPAKEHAGAVHNAIQRRRGLPADGQDTSGVKEEFIADAAEQDQNDKKITGKGVNNYGGKNPVVRVMPEDPSADRTSMGVSPRSVYAHTELEGELIAETGYQKFLNMLQEKTLSAKQKGKKEDVFKSLEPSKLAKQYPEKSPKEIKSLRYAISTSVAKKVAEEEESEMDKKPKNDKGKGCEDDMRSLPTKTNIVKNKLRSMGLKMSYEPEGEMTESRYYRGNRGPDRNSLGGSDRNSGRNRYIGSPTPEQEAEENRRADAAAERAKARLRANLAREASRRNQGG